MFKKMFPFREPPPFIGSRTQNTVLLFLHLRLTITSASSQNSSVFLIRRVISKSIAI